MAGTRNFDDDRWQLFHTDVDRAEAHDLAAEHPEKLEELKASVVRGGRGQLRAAAERPADHRQPEGLRDVRRDGVPRAGPAERAVHVLPGHERDPGALGRQRAQRVVQGRSPRSSSTPGTEGVIFAHGSRFGGHALFVKDGKVTYAYNFLGIPPEDRISAPVPTAGPAHHRRRVHQGADGRAPRGRRTAQAVHRRPARRRGRDPHRDGPLLAVRRRSVHRLRQRRPRQLDVRRPGSRSPAARSRRSCSTSPTTPTSTSRPTSRRQWRATERSSPPCHHAQPRSRTTSTPSTRPAPVVRAAGGVHSRRATRRRDRDLLPDPAVQGRQAPCRLECPTCGRHHPHHHIAQSHRGVRATAPAVQDEQGDIEFDIGDELPEIDIREVVRRAVAV